MPRPVVTGTIGQRGRLSPGRADGHPQPDAPHLPTVTSAAIKDTARLVPTRKELLLNGTATLIAAMFILAVGPQPGDAPAHLYRTFLVQHGIVLWDNLWYAGQYPLASYSLLYYFPAALVGNLPLVLGAAVAATLLFALISYREWGQSAFWPTRIFGVLAAAPMFTGLYAYTLGFAAMLAALRLLQYGKTWLVVVFAALTLGFSPLAFCFLGLILCAVFIARRAINVRVVKLTIALGAIAAFEVAVLVLFPTPGDYPFNPYDFVAVMSTSTAGALLAWRGGRDRLIASFFVTWALGSAVLYVVPTTVGDNWTRLRGFVFPIMLIAALQARFRPRGLTVIALSLALAYNLTPYLMLIPYRLSSSPQTSGFWQPAVNFLDRNAGEYRRVEVVPTAAHWESYWISRAGFALARGWYRQLDEATNPLFYKPHLTGSAYRAWMRQMGIKYVLLPKTKLDPWGGPTEAKLLRSGAAGLKEVFNSPGWTIYELRDPTPLLTGSASAHLVSLGHDRIVGYASAAGSYYLRVHYTPYWTVSPHGSCVSRSANGMTELKLPHGGQFSLGMPGGVLASLDSVFDAIVKPAAKSCLAR